MSAGRQLRCRVGDLAIVVKAPESPETVGRIVTVLARTTIDRPGYDWEVRSNGTPFHLPKKHCYSSTGHISDIFLVPLRPRGRERKTETIRSKRRPVETRTA